MLTLSSNSVFRVFELIENCPDELDMLLFVIELEFVSRGIEPQWDVELLWDALTPAHRDAIGIYISNSPHYRATFGQYVRPIES